MADKTDKLPGQPVGKFYVDTQCIDCNICRNEAPNNFTRNEELGLSVVSKQPENSQEEEDCRSALKDCPVDAIGDDGAEDLPAVDSSAEPNPS